MADVSPLTKQDLQEALQEVVKTLATKADLSVMQTELKDYVHQGVESIENSMGQLFDQQGRRLGKIEQELKTINRRLIGLEQDTISRKEFIELKTQVETLHPFG